MTDSLQTTMFADHSSNWIATPYWVRFFIGWGANYFAASEGTRRIALFSLPCDSCAAGLIALGAMLARLEVPNANDLDHHFERIMALANRPDSEVRIFKRSDQVKTRKAYVLRGQYQPGFATAYRVGSKSNESITISRATCTDWQFEGEPPVLHIHGAALPNARLYQALQPGQLGLRPENLRHSDSAVCFGGRHTGEKSTRDYLSNCRLRHGEISADLAQLLTVFGWGPADVSRVSYFNARTRELDRGFNPSLVVCDGGVSFLRALECEFLRSSDIVGVFHRLVYRDELENIGTKIETLRQWYDANAAPLLGIPVGVGHLLMRRA